MLHKRKEKSMIDIIDSKTRADPYFIGVLSNFFLGPIINIYIYIYISLK